MSCCIYCVYSLVLQQEQDSHPVSTFGTSETCLFMSEAILTKKKKKHIKRIYIFILFSIKMFQYCVMYTYGMLLSLYVLYSGNKINSNCGPDGNLWGQNNY